MSEHRDGSFGAWKPLALLVAGTVPALLLALRPGEGGGVRDWWQHILAGMVLGGVVYLCTRRYRTAEAGGGGALVAFAGIAILALSVVFNEYGILHFEWWHHYVSFHLGPGSIWKKIFDNRTLDLGVYAGRELSYLVDHLDMLAMAASVRWGFPLFVSVVHLLLSVGMGIWIAHYASRDLKLGPLIGLLLALLLWTTPCIYLHFLMRTAKGLTAAGLVVLAVELHRACAGGGNHPSVPLRRRSIILIGLSALVMSFADRQGFYFLLCAIGCMAFEWWRSRARVARDSLLLLLAVLAVGLVYFFWLAPALTRQFWGYDSDFSFNKLPMHELYAQPVRFATQAGELLLQTIGFTVGAIPRWLAAILLVGLFALAGMADIRGRSWRRQLPLSLLLGGLLVALWMMYALMILRHPPLLWDEIRRVYYWIPTSALIVLALGVGAGVWSARQPGVKPMLAALFAVLVVGNVLALPGHRRVLSAGALHESISTSREMRHMLMHGRDSAYLDSAEFERLPAFRTLWALAPSRHARSPVPPDGQEGFGPFAWRAGAVVKFLKGYGGNTDSRFLATSGGLYQVSGGRGLIGITEGGAEMRVRFAANRLQAEMVLCRADNDAGGPLAVDFAVYASPVQYPEMRFERWRGRLELPAGENQISVRQDIDGSSLSTVFTVEIPAEYSGRVIAGWRNPDVQHVTRDTAQPLWLSHSRLPVVELEEPALSRLLPAGWRPERAFMRGGRIGENGIELSPGGEIWLRAPEKILRFKGRSVRADGVPTLGVNVTGLWYKGGRMQYYNPPMSDEPSSGTQSFQATSAEPGGWLVIAADDGDLWGKVMIHVTEVVEL